MKKSARSWPLAIAFAVIAVLPIVRTANDFSSPESNMDQIWGEATLTLLGLFFLAIAAIILLKDRNNLVGWALLGPVVANALDGTGRLMFGPLAELPYSLSIAQAIYVWFNGTSWWLLIGPIFLISLVYPDGKLAGKIQRLGFRMLSITFGLFMIFASFSEKLENTQNEGQLWANPIGFIPIEISEIFFGVFAVLLLLTALICLAAIVLRYRGSYGVEKAQMKWLFYAMSLFLVIYVINGLLQNTEAESSQALNIAFLGSVTLIPIAIGIGIMKYRLWDIDLVINRSLVYGILTAIIAAVWAGSLAVIDQVITNLAGDSSKVASTVLSTLLAASIVQPARTRIEQWTNKRFFPEKRQLEKGFIEIEPRFWGDLDMKQVAQLSVERVCKLMKASKGAFLVENSDGAFVPVASYGIETEDFQVWSPIKKDMKDLQDEGAITMENDPEFDVFVPLYIPRVGPNDVLGLLALSRRKYGRGYSGDDKKALTQLGLRLGEFLYKLKLRDMQ